VGSLDDYAAWVLRPRLPEKPTVPSSSYFVCGTPRSGSWLLCGLLASTGVAGRSHEWFYRETEETNRRAWGVARFADYLQCVRDAGTTPNGIFGSKLMWTQLDEFVERLGQLGDAASNKSLLERHFPNPSFVWIRRKDTVAQAVSWAKAIQTGQWHHWDSADSSDVPVYDRNQIEALAREVVENNAGWEAWFEAIGIDPLVIRFEELVADPVLVTREVLTFMRVALDGVTICPQTVPTGDHVNMEWLARHRG
jgi:LPS sulfotransferase NodH